MGWFGNLGKSLVGGAKKLWGSVGGVKGLTKKLGQVSSVAKKVGDVTKSATPMIQKVLGKLKNDDNIGDKMKQLEISAEKAQERKEILLYKIHTLLEQLKVAEARFEYGEMNVSKLNLRYTNHFHHANHTS